VNAKERIEHDASAWLSKFDALGTEPEQDEEFNRWLEADIRHRVAYLRLEAAWKRAERLKERKPLDGGVDPDLLAPARPPRWRRWPTAAAAGLATIVACAGVWAAWLRYDGQRYETHVGCRSRIVLEDGSVIDLNTNSELRVRFDEGRREIKLLRGEGRFQVAHDATRPFVVSAAGADLRAVGTQFSVRLRESHQIDVLVAEGEVAIASQRVPQHPSLHAGDAAVVTHDRVSVSRIEPQVLAQRLAWTSGRLEFRGESLAFAVEEFNRYNRRKISLADPKLAQLRVGGSFKSTDPDSFAAALASTFGLKVLKGDAERIVLRPP
jgi:transmembrane sensor